jgi:hypothetical protein
MTEDQRMEHALLVHDLEAFECVTCAMKADRRCTLCAGHVVYYRMNCSPCGRADCPVGRRAQ